MATRSTTLIWFRNDLRLNDSPAIQAALERGGPVVPVFIWAPEEAGEWSPGGASNWWLHRSLLALRDSLQALGTALIVRRGPSLATLRELIRETGAGAVIWTRCYEPAAIQRDKQIKEALRAEGVIAESVNGSLLHEPWTIKTKSGGPYQVFTPFWRCCLAQPAPAAPLPAPTHWPSAKSPPRSIPIAELGLDPTPGWASQFSRHATPGEAGAQRVLKEFLRTRLGSYDTDRDRPDQEGTSRLSAHLHFGEVSPRQIWHACGRLAARTSSPAQPWQESRFLTEVGWREFAFHLLYHFPHTPTLPLKHEFERFPWREDPMALRMWQKGRTGYPLVDAGMRQLWATGWMHNRVRMVTASFLVKHLLLPWQAGAKWFWDTLIDADLANNTLGWQWTAGCGADAAPFFRIFNPVSQGEKFDPEGTYVREWVPELRRLPASVIHQPWTAAARVLNEAGVRLGENYPLPIVDHSAARTSALAAYARARG